MASKRKLNQSASLAHFGFTSKKVAPRDGDDAGAASSMGPLATRTQDPFPSSDSPEEGLLRPRAPKTTLGLTIRQEDWGV